MTNLETSAMRKVAWRLVPFVSFAYLINILDRFNISFAALTMNKALGFSATAYGLGAGAFFWSYVAFQIPANLALERVGARRWLMSIMLLWGVFSACMALVHGIIGFVIVRFLLGMAEAGFFPGVTYFMTRWFPSRHRGRAMGVFLAFGASAGIIGGPVATHLLALDGWLGIAGWRWLFLAEGIPAVLFAIGCLLVLRDKPSDASWLTEEERSWLEARLAEERKDARGSHLSFSRAAFTPSMMVMMLLYLLIGCGVYGQVYFLPLMMKSLGFGNITVGYLVSLTAIAGVIGMVVVSRSSDRTGERVWHVIAPLLIGGAGLIAAGLAMRLGPALTIVAFCVAGFGVSASIPVFWNLPTAFLSSAAAAGGIALINAAGNISGYAAPQIVGVLRDLTGGYEVPMLVVGALVFVAGLIVPLAGHVHADAPGFAAAQGGAPHVHL
jgi:MFS transporter, ACS family, tartrate transporter